MSNQNSARQSWQFFESAHFTLMTEGFATCTGGRMGRNSSGNSAPSDMAWRRRPPGFTGLRLRFLMEPNGSYWFLKKRHLYRSAAGV